MNIMDLITEEDMRRHQSGASPNTYHAYREMFVPAGPGWVEEHLQRPGRGRHPAALPADRHDPDLETVERLVRARPLYGPAQPHLGGHRRRPRRAQSEQLHGIHPPRSGNAVAHAGMADAQRPAAQRHGHVPWACTPAAARGHLYGRRGEHDDLGPADRADRADRQRTGRRDRDRQGSARNLQDRHPVQQRRRDAGQLGMVPNRVPNRRAVPTGTRHDRDGRTSASGSRAMPGSCSR